MGFDLNSEAYKYLAKIEVGVREFFIYLIKEKGIKEWTENFLSKFHYETIADISKRIVKAKKDETVPNIEDVYIHKLERVKKEYINIASELYHPFYYLDWTDMENIISMKSNSYLFEQYVKKPDLEVLSKVLNSLKFIRNDIAHSRFITDEDFKSLRTSYDKVSDIIPNFEKFLQLQSKEENVSHLLFHLLNYIKSISKPVLLHNSEIEDFTVCINKCLNSFWLNSSLHNVIITHLDDLKSAIIEYKKFRNMPGGLLKIQIWRSNNEKLMCEIKKFINERKI